jgi:hypothetical protein
MYKIAFDPGLRNMGVWAGIVDENGMPKTLHLGKFDVVQDKKKPLYEGVIDLVLNTEWMSDPTKISEAVVETQAVKNIPARIAATAIYGALRGRGISTKFSGSALKNKTMDIVSEKLGVSLIAKPDKLAKDAETKDKAARKRLMHSVNKKNSASLVKAILQDIKDADTLQIFEKADKNKVDDLADAMLLGMGICLDVSKIKTCARRKQKTIKVNSTVDKE